MTPRQSKDTARVPLPSVDQAQEESELLTIDGELEDVKTEQRTLRKKKKGRSKGGGADEEEGEVVRMMDFKPHGLVPRRPSNSSDTSGRTEVPKGAAQEHGQVSREGMITSRRLAVTDLTRHSPRVHFLELPAIE
jgi:hypothetical protein